MTLALKPTAYILAESYQQGHNSAGIDWGWEQVGPDHYRIPDDEIAMIVTREAALRGKVRKAKLYLG